jgi:hypothetical protein
MRRNYSAVFILILVFVASNIGIAQESKTYTDPVDRYQIQLAGEWQEVSSTEASGARRLVIVFQGHSDRGELRIKKSSLADTTFEKFLKTEEESAYRYLPGYIKIKHEETFGGGKLSGKMIEFDFKRYNNPKLARYYYVEDGKGNVWSLMFSGEPKIIKNIRPDTDVMARSFKPLE